MRRFLPRVVRESDWVAPLAALCLGLALVNAVFDRLLPAPGPAPPTPTPETAAFGRPGVPPAPATATPPPQPTTRPPPPSPPARPAAAPPSPAPAAPPATPALALRPGGGAGPAGGAVLPRAPSPPVPSRAGAPASTPTTAVSQTTAWGAPRSGEFEAELVHDDGTRATARLAFDLGGAGRPPRLHLVSTYGGEDGEQRAEQITVGGRTWRREGDGEWADVPGGAGVADQVRAFLPPPGAVTDPDPDVDGPSRAWRGSEPSAGVVVTFDPASGEPRRLVEVRPDTGSVRTVTYVGWNTAVEVEPPAGR